MDIKLDELGCKKSILEILLKDNSTGKNIVWATDKFSPITFSDAYFLIKPRNEKSKEEQLKRVRQKAEFFTPSWVCALQNDLLDKDWFVGGKLKTEN